MKFLTVFFVLIVSLFGAEVLPSSKIVPSRMLVPNGSPHGLGVPGGIPARTSDIVDLTVSPYSFVAGGNVTTALQAAIDALPSSGSEKTILIPPGSHTMSSVDLGYKSDFTIRGAGMGSTVITATGGIRRSAYPRWGDPNLKSDTVTGGLTKDSTTITLVDASDFQPNCLAKIKLPNDYTLPVLQPNNIAQYVRSYVVYVTSVDTGANTVTFTPPLPTDWSGLAALTGIPVLIESEVEVPVGKNIGIEDLRIIHTGGSSDAPIDISGCKNLWIKGVRIGAHINHGMHITSSVAVEIFKSFIGENSSGIGSNRSGILFETTTNTWVYDSTLEGNMPLIEYWVTNTHSVFSYNYCPWGYGNLGVNTHNAHNSFILLEGNIMFMMQSDSYFGSNSEVVFNRDWLLGRRTPFGAESVETPVTDIQRFTRNFAFINCIFRVPGFTSPDKGYYFGYPYAGWLNAGTAELSLGDPWVDWDSTNNRIRKWDATLQTRTTDTTGIASFSTADANTLETSLNHAASAGMSLDRTVTVIPPGIVVFSARITSTDTFPIEITSPGNVLPSAGTEFVVTPGVYGFRERDLDTLNTMTLRGNYNFYDNAVPAGEAMGSDTAPDSYVHSSKPSWFGSIPFPVVNPLSPPAAWDEATVKAMLPAAWRYYNNNEDYLTGGSSGTDANMTVNNLTVGAIQ